MKFGIVNDMPMIAEALRRTLMLVQGYEVAWIAHDGASAIDYCRIQKPDLILLDLIMPGIDGVEVTRQIMQHSPCPILLVTSSVDSNMSLVFQALGLGALDAVDTPQLSGINTGQSTTVLLEKIKQISRLINYKNNDGNNARNPIDRLDASNLVVIGASAGGPAALNTVLSQLPTGFEAAILVVQHIDMEFVGNLAKWLTLECTLPLALAVDGDRPTLGKILLANGYGHLVMARDNRLRYVQDPINTAYRPSVNVLFESVCKHWQGNLIGVLLTGMGLDGASGLKSIRDKGHYTIAQDKASCAIFGMPKAAIELGAAVDVLPVTSIASALVKSIQQLQKREITRASIQ